MKNGGMDTLIECFSSSFVNDNFVSQSLTHLQIQTNKDVYAFDCLETGKLLGYYHSFAIN